jgi:hypothetical protein
MNPKWKKNQENENQIKKKKDYGTKDEIEKKILRVKSYISSNFELKGKIEKKNQIHKRI